MPADAAQTWRLIEDYDRDAIWNMAADAALLLGGSSVPTLRLYTWTPAALSIGYFQRVADIPEAARRLETGEPLVRRRTGGGAIHHANELTFSIAAPDTHPLYRGPIAASYTRVHALVAEALTAFGVEASERGDRQLVSDTDGTGMCFHASHPLDLVWETPQGPAKGVGSAQRRTGGHVLHHGSIKLAPDPLEPNVATVAIGRAEPSPADLGNQLVATIQRRLGVDLTSSDYTSAERATTGEEAAGFESPQFLRRR